MRPQTLARVLLVSLATLALAACGRFKPDDKVEALQGEDVTQSFKGSYDGPDLALSALEYAAVAVFGQGRLALLRVCTSCKDNPYKPIDVDFYGTIRAVKNPHATEIKAYPSFSCRSLRKAKIDRDYYFTASVQGDEIVLDEVSTRKLLPETLRLRKVPLAAALRDQAPTTGVRGVDIGCFNEDGRIDQKQYETARPTFDEVASFVNEAATL